MALNTLIGVEVSAKVVGRYLDIDYFPGRIVELHLYILVREILNRLLN